MMNMRTVLALATLEKPRRQCVIEGSSQGAVRFLGLPRCTLVSFMAASRAVLVVDDDPDCIEVMVEALRGLDCAVYGAGDGREALNRLSAVPRPCVILLDVLMRPMSGAEFLQALSSRADAADFSVIAMSGDVQAARQLQGIAAVLTKPFEIAELDALLEKLFSPQSSHGSVGSNLE